MLQNPSDKKFASRLILSQIDKDFSPDRDIPLGVWCFSGVEGLYPDWESIPFPNITFETEVLSDWNSKSEKLCSQLIVERGVLLNELHTTNYSSLYWRELLLPWISTVINISLGKYLYLKNYIERYGDQHIQVQIDADLNRQWKVPETIDLAHLTNKAEFDFWLSSLILSQIAPKKWSLFPKVHENKADEEEQSYITPPVRTSILKKMFRRVFKRLSFSDVPGVVFGNLWFSLVISFLPCRPNWTPHLKDNPGVKKVFPTIFLKLVENILDRTMPLSFSETFSDRNSATDRLTFKRGRLLITGSTKFNENHRFMTAKALQCGERVVRTQHGGSPGISKINVGFWYDFGYHAYLSWGWTNGYARHNGIVPLSSPILTKFSHRHRRLNSCLILVGTKMIPELQIFRAGPQPLDLIKYRKAKQKFIRKLNPEIRREMAYRPYQRSETGLEDERYILKKFPNLKILTQNFHRELLKCALMVHDHPGTTFLISMAANCPTIGFWKPTAWPVTDTAKSELDHLRDAKILFDSHAEAADHINLNWDEISSWWYSRKVQSVRMRFCNKFARTNTFWWVEWLRVISRL